MLDDNLHFYIRTIAENLTAKPNGLSSNFVKEHDVH